MSYVWDFGEGPVAGAATMSYEFPSENTFPVTLTVTDNDGASAVVTNDVTVAFLNQSPTADFEVTQDFLAVHFVASASDPDGTIASYSWNFGDGNLGTGAIVDHTLRCGRFLQRRAQRHGQRRGRDGHEPDGHGRGPEPATGGEVHLQHDMLSATFNAAGLGGSSDADGTIVSYAWDFGDTETGAGVNPTHTYATANTYSVTLTVTDDDGATASVTHPVTVTAAPPVLARDAFDRTVTGGWGSANLGGAWTVTSASRLSVNNVTGGAMSLAVSTGPLATLNATPIRDLDETVKVVADKQGTGGGYYVSLIGRRTGTSDYRLKVRILNTAVTAYLVRTLNGVETIVATQTIAGISYQPGDVLNLRLRVAGTGTTTLDARCGPATPPSRRHGACRAPTRRPACSPQAPWACTRTSPGSATDAARRGALRRPRRLGRGALSTEVDSGPSTDHSVLGPERSVAATRAHASLTGGQTRGIFQRLRSRALGGIAAQVSQALG